MANRKSQQGTLECFGVEVPGVWQYHFPAGTPPTASAHMSAPRNVKQLRTMTHLGRDLFLCVVLKFRQFIVFYCILSLLSLVLPAIAEKSCTHGYRVLFFHPLMARGPFHSCTYVDVGSRTAGSHLSSCVHSLSTDQLAVALSLRVVANL